MSLAKKSVLWLVAAIVVFALALTAVFAASPVNATAQAELPTAKVVAEASSSEDTDALPDLVSGTARTITVNYYIQHPVASNHAIYKLAPVLVLPNASTVPPTSITMNPVMNANTIITLDEEEPYDSLAAYLHNDAAFFVAEIKSVDTIPAGLTVSGDTYTTVSNAYLFTATYALASDAAAGTYSFALSANNSILSLSDSADYALEVVDGGADATKGSFNIRSLVTIPVADAQAEPYVYNGSEKTFAFTTASLIDAAYINFADNVKTNAGTYTVTASLKDPATTAWVGNTTADQTYTFTIEKKPVTIPTAVANLVYNDSAQTGVTVDYTDYTKASGTIEETAAGNYSATFALNDTANTEWADAELGEEITNKTVEWSIGYLLVTKPTATTTTYYYSPNAEQTYSFASVGDSDKYTVANDKRTNAGTQTVTATLANASYKWADGTTEPLEFTFRIKKIRIMAAVCANLEDNTFTYTGEPITCNFIYEGETSYFTMTGHVQTDVGQYDVTQTLNDTTNYAWSHRYEDDDEPMAYAPYVQHTAFEITKKAVTIPTAISGLEYTGSAQSGVNKVDGNFYELYSGSDEETAVGNYSATYNLKSTTNCYWADDVTDVANKTVNWSIGKAQITKPSISASFKVYNGESQSYSGSGTGYSFTGSGTNAGDYPVTVSLTDKNNSVWAGTDSAADYSEADKLIIAKKTVRLTLTESADSSVYGDSVATITAGINPDYAPINAADIGTVSYTAKNFQTNVIYTKAEFETIRTAPVGNYILTAVCSVDNDNYSVEGQTLPYEITKRYITVPTVTTDTYPYDGQAHSIVFSGVDSDYVDVASVSETNIGTYPVAVSLKAAYAGNIAWNDDGYTTEAKEFTLKIEVSQVTVSLAIRYGEEVVNIVEGESYDVFSPIPAVPTVRWFRSVGYVFDEDVVTVFDLDMDGETLIADMIYNVGMGDVTGDGIVTVRDIIQMKRYYIGLDASKKVEDADDAWSKRSASLTNPVLESALDVNNDGAFLGSDIIAVREALATGYSYAIIVNSEITGVTGQAVIPVPERLTITTYDEDDAYGWSFVKAVKSGYPIALGADISAATASFNETLVAPADIDLAGYTLTVNKFTMSNSATDVTLKIWNSANTTGSIFTVEGISITAPNGNVIVSGISGYSYEGTTVTLAAASSSLHVESNVGFYQYKVEGKATAQDYKESVTTDDAIDEVALTPETGVIATTQAKVAEMTAEKAALAELEAEKQALIDAGEEAEVINAKVDEINDKIADIDAIDVFKAPVFIPVDTHVVVEEEATLAVEQITVTEAQGANAATANTFSIEVKSAATEVVTVDITAVKETVSEVNYYHVEEVALAGDTSKVEIVKADDQTVETSFGVKNTAELKAAVAVGGDILIGANINLTEEITIANDATLNMNGYTITSAANAPAFKIQNGSLTLAGKGVVTGTNNKYKTIYFMGSTDQSATNYSVLNVGADVTVESTNGYAIMVSANSAKAYGVVANIAGTVNGYYGSLYVNGSVARQTGDVVNDEPIASVASFNIASTAKLYAPIYAAGFAKWDIATGASVTGETAIYIKSGFMTVANGVNLTATGVDLAYVFDGNGFEETGDGIVIDNCYYPGANPVVTFGNSLEDTITIADPNRSKIGVYWAVSNEAQLTAALSAQATYIFIRDNFNTVNPIVIDHSVTINGNNKTITSSGNRIINVTAPDLTITIEDLTMTSATSERGLNIWDSATGSDITLNNVYIDAHLYAINYVNGADDATLVVNDSYLKGWGAINAHFNDSSVVVNNSTLYGINRTSDHTYGFNTITIDGDSLHGAQEGEHGVNNTFVFDGCTIIAEVRDTHQDWISFQYAATGNTATVVVNNCEILDAPNGNDKTYAMSIQGTNNAVVLPLSAEQYAIVAAKHFNITDNGNGIYTVMPKTTNISYFGTPYNFYDVFENGWLEDTEAFTLTDDVTLDTDVVFAANRAAAIAVSGGTFEMNLDGNTISGEGKIILPVGVTCVTDSETSIASIFEAPEGEVIIESVDADGNYIYAVGKAYVKTKAEFAAAITAGAKEIVICANINLSMYTYNRDMDITIDLNGYTLTTTMTGITFSAARTLNIKDSSANGTGAINSTGNYAINMGTSSTADTVINVYGGTLTGKTSAAVKVNDGALNVYGGTLTCPAADKYAILNYQGYAGTVNIYDGTFTAAVAVANNGTGEVNIYGGTFSADPSAFVAPGYVANEEDGIWTVEEEEAIEITTFAELSAAIANVNNGTLVNPTLRIMNDIAFENELEINKSVTILGDMETKFIGYDATGSYNDALFINTTDADQTVTIQGIVFDHFCYYSNVANKTKATASGAKNGVSVLTYAGACAASTTLNLIDCEVIGTGRDMINVSSSAGCAGTINISGCTFDATDRLSGTLNMLSFYGKTTDTAVLIVNIDSCIFSEATEQNTEWATTAISSFGNAVITVDDCTFEDCQVAIGIDNTFNRLYAASTYPVTVNTTCTLNDVTYVNCYFGYYEESVFASVDEIPEGAELYTDEPFTYGDYEATRFSFAAEYDLSVAGTQGVDAKYLVVACYYVEAMTVEGSGQGAQGDPGLED